MVTFGKRGGVVIGTRRTEASWADVPVGASELANEKIINININYI